MKSPPPALPKTILLVDDHDEYRVMAKWFLISFGFIVESARTATEALALFDPETHDLVITDNSMPGMSGAEMAAPSVIWEVLRAMGNSVPSFRRLMISPCHPPPSVC